MIKGTSKKQKLINALLGLGVVSVLAIGIALYFYPEEAIEPEKPPVLDINAWLPTIEVWNDKVQEIKADSKTDIRAISKDRVIFKDIKGQEDIKRKLNEWLIKDFEDPTFYKTKITK